VVDEKTQATTRRLPPQLSHVSKSAPQVRFSNSAHGILEGGLAVGCSSRGIVEGRAVGAGAGTGASSGGGVGTTSGRRRALAASTPNYAERSIMRSQPTRAQGQARPGLRIMNSGLLESSEARRWCWLGGGRASTSANRH
jgi:hypothetical protein